jgi:hypothetical protein
MWMKRQRWLVTAGEWAVLLPLWRRLIDAPRGRAVAAGATGAVWLVAIAAAVVIADGGGDADPASDERVAEARASATPTRTASPAGSRTPSPVSSVTAGATPQPEPDPEQAPAVTAPPAVSADGAAPPAPGQVLTVVSSSMYTDDVGALHVAGEVRNNGAEYMELVEITGTFFDAAGQAVASEFTFTHADIVAPEEVAGFDLTVGGGGSLAVSHYALAVKGTVTAERPVSGLVIQGESASIDESGDLHVVGSVLNQSTGPVEFVKVIGTFYGTDGTVLRSASAHTELDEVPAGGMDSFDLAIVGGDSVGYARYELKVEGFSV